MFFVGARKKKCSQLDGSKNFPNLICFLLPDAIYSNIRLKVVMLALLILIREIAVRIPVE
jgi:hypothetical protein